MAAKRQRSHAARRDAGPSRSRGLAWFLAGGVAGGLVTWAMLGHDPAAERVRATVERTVGRSIGVEPVEPPPKPKFEFYTLLPEMEVVVPDDDLPAAAPAPAPTASGTTDESGTADTAVTAGSTAGEETQVGTETALKSGHYILQVASFRRMQDADGLKAQLTLLGYRPVVQTVAIDSDKKWHRVRIGPYADRAALEAARIQLRAHGHDNPLVVWVKKG